MGMVTLDLDRRFQAIAEVASETIGAKAVTLAVLDPESGLLSIKRLHHSNRANGDVLKALETLASDFDLTQIEFSPDINPCFRKARELGGCIGCTFEETFQGILPPAFISARQKAFPDHRTALFPLRASSEIWANLQAIGYLVLMVPEKTLSPRQVKMMKACAEQAAQAVENLMLVERERRKAEELAVVAAVSQTITSTLELTDVLQRIAESAKAFFKSDNAAAWIMREKGAGPEHSEMVLELITTVGPAGGGSSPRSPLPFGEGIPGLAAQEKKPVIVRDAQKDPGPSEEGRRYFQENNINAVLAVPMIWGDLVVGVLVLEFMANREFSEDMVELAQILAGQGAIAIHNAKIHELVQLAATKDPLTGVFNHSFFHTGLRAELARTKRSGTPLSIIMLDLDNFKEVNDTFGHLAGDRVLKEMGALLSGTVRAYDVVARYGGDEFALILPGANRQEGEQAAQRITGIIATHPFPLGGDCQHRLTASAGVASYPVDGENPDALIFKADMGLYINKGRRLSNLAGQGPTSSPSHAL